LKEQWAYLDPKARQRNKLVKVGEGAAWYWACGLMYCRDSDHEADRPGFIPDYQAFHLYATKRARSHVKRLTEEGLWVRVEGGFLIAGYGKVYGRDDGASVDQIVEELAAPVPSAVSAARAAAGRSGGLRSGEVRSVLLGKQNEGLLPKQTPGSSFGSGSRSGSLNPENPKENPLPRDLNRSAREGVCFEEDGSIFTLGVRERANLIVDDHQRFASILKPHRWPEVMQLVAAFTVATGSGRGVAAYDRDGGVRALVALLAAFDFQTLLRVLPTAVTSAWWQEEPSRPLAHLSVTVIENAMGAMAREANVTDLIEAARVRKASPSSPPPPIMLTRGEA
jgi:hypothetical protein